MKFKVTYPSGLVEETITDAESVEDFVNAKFGSTYDTFVENGGTIETDADPVPEDAVTEGEDAAPKRSHHRHR
jgi:hypothetical protein